MGLRLRGAAAVTYADRFTRGREARRRETRRVAIQDETTPLGPSVLAASRENLSSERRAWPERFITLVSIPAHATASPILLAPARRRGRARLAQLRRKRWTLTVSPGIERVIDIIRESRLRCAGLAEYRRTSRPVSPSAPPLGVGGCPIQFRSATAAL